MSTSQAFQTTSPPGKKWAYSNHAYNTLGQLVEDIGGEPFEEYMRRHVFEPLGMDSTAYVLGERVRETFAQGREFSRGKLRPVDYLEISVRGAGSVFSSVDGMCRYVAALLGGGANQRGRLSVPHTRRPGTRALDPLLALD